MNSFGGNLIADQSKLKETFQSACKAEYLDILKLLVKDVQKKQDVQKTQDVENGLEWIQTDLLQMCLFSDNIYARDAMNEKNTNASNFKLGKYLNNLKGMDIYDKHNLVLF